MNPGIQLPPIDLRGLIEHLDNVISVVGLILNSILLWCILTKTTNHLKDYKPILIQNCLVDFFYNIINTITKTVRITTLIKRFEKIKI